MFKPYNFEFSYFLGLILAPIASTVKRGHTPLDDSLHDVTDVAPTRKRRQRNQRGEKSDAGKETEEPQEKGR